MEEERRQLYVGITRSKKYLFQSYILSMEENQYNSPAKHYIHKAISKVNTVDQERLQNLAENSQKSIDKYINKIDQICKKVYELPLYLIAPALEDIDESIVQEEKRSSQCTTNSTLYIHSSNEDAIKNTIYLSKLQTLHALSTTRMTRFLRIVPVTYIDVISLARRYLHTKGQVNSVYS